MRDGIFLSVKETHCLSSKNMITLLSIKTREQAGRFQFHVDVNVATKFLQVYNSSVNKLNLIKII